DLLAAAGDEAVLQHDLVILVVRRAIANRAQAGCRRERADLVAPLGGDLEDRADADLRAAHAVEVAVVARDLLDRRAVVPQPTAVTRRLQQDPDRVHQPRVYVVLARLHRRRAPARHAVDRPRA